MLNTANIINTKLKKENRIFVNRSLNMAKIKAVGFDMDHTLALYNKETFENLAFQETIKKMVQLGYPQELLKLEFNPHFAIRGLLVDKERGNLLKMDGHKYVKIAYHGHRKLHKEERHETYNVNTVRAADFLSVDTLFSLSEVQLYAEIVDYLNKHPKSIKKSYREIYDEVRFNIDLSHRDGTIKSQVLAAPEKYLLKDPNLPTSLLNLIETGKKLFLLTNSLWDYTSHIMSYLLDNQVTDLPSWRDFFDYVVVGASKPGFFTGSQPFYEVEQSTGLLKVHEGKLSFNKIYHGGNAVLFQNLTGLHGDEILYVGDHIYGDIMRSKGRVNWRTMLVIEELRNELPKIEETQKLLDTIQEHLAEKEKFEEDLQRLRQKIAINRRQLETLTEESNKGARAVKERDIEKLTEKEKVLAEQVSTHELKIKELIRERDQVFHPIWGELMKVGLEKSRIADQVEQYACVYSSRMSNLRFYSPFKKFTSFHELLPHDL